MKQYLNGMDWANKTSPVKEIKYEEDEIEDLNETGFDELDLELQKFNKEKEEYKQKHKEEEVDEDEESEELEKIKDPPYQK